MWLFLLSVVLLSSGINALDCAHGETRNPITGVCACFLGWGGADCSKPLKPACARPSAMPLRLGWPVAYTCAFESALSCECRRQCHQDPWRDGTELNKPCFENGANSAFPRANAPGVRYLSGAGPNATEVTRDKLTWVGSPLVSLDECPGQCSGEGVCMRRRGDKSARCMCFPGLTGPQCAEVTPKGCLMGCTGRGTCARGVCICNPGWFGMACTEKLSDDKHQRTKLAIHVMELPTEQSIAWAIDSDINDMGVRWDSPRADMQFLRHLLQDNVTRVPSPEQANLIYVPTFSSVVCQVGGKQNVQRISSLISAVNGTNAWQRNNGRNFVFAAACDMGACSFTPEMRRVIIMTEYGLVREETRNGGDPESTCFVRDRGVVLPPDEQAPAFTSAVATSIEAYSHNSSRPCLFFFHGTIGKIPKTIPEPNVPGGYSQGVRWRVAKAVQGAPDALVTESTSEKHRLEGLRLSVFCLAPSGHGYGVRLSSSILNGCIPVIIQPSVAMPCDDVLPYPEFSVRLQFSEIPRIMDILRAISPSEVTSMQHKLKHYHPSFIWRIDAYKSVLASLERKLYNLQSEFAPF